MRTETGLAVTIQPSSLITTKAPQPQSVVRSKYRRETTTGRVKQIAFRKACANMEPPFPAGTPRPPGGPPAGRRESLPSRGRNGRRAASRAWLVPRSFPGMYRADWWVADNLAAGVHGNGKGIHLTRWSFRRAAGAVLSGIISFPCEGPFPSPSRGGSSSPTGARAGAGTASTPADPPGPPTGSPRTISNGSFRTLPGRSSRLPEGRRASA